LLALFWVKSLQAQEKERAYSISLVKTAEVEEDIVEVDDQKVLTQEYIIQKGDYVWKILRKKGLLKQHNLSQVLSALKKLNRSFRNLDLVHPGEKIIIPLKIIPITGGNKGGTAKEGPLPEKMKQETALKELDFENYTVRPGDGLIRVVKGRYKIPEKILYNKYLGLFKRLNPSIKDLNTISPGQVVRLPIYSPEIVRKPIKMATLPKQEAKEEDEETNQKVNPLAHGLGIIFSEMGEEWVQSGEHFIPLKSGGQIDLKAKSFPIINLQNGLRVIVDLNNKLPDKMASLIASTWGNYRVVHLTERDDLRASMDKILRVCAYPEIFKGGEPIELQGEISFRITADWIITLSETRWDDRLGTIVINLSDAHTTVTPRVIKDYLEGLGVNVVDFPPGDEDAFDEMNKVELLEVGGDHSKLIKTVLDLTGQTYSTHVGIPVYQSQGSELNFTINADFFVNLDGRDAIIDLSGLSSETISFLEQHQFLVQSFAAATDPHVIVAETLELFDIEFNAGPHFFMATPREDSRNIRLTLPGIVFADSRGKPILATPLSLPEEIKAFLSHKGYKVLALS
jgi:hypothetical protein